MISGIGITDRSGGFATPAFRTRTVERRREQVQIVMLAHVLSFHSGFMLTWGLLKCLAASGKLELCLTMSNAQVLAFYRRPPYVERLERCCDRRRIDVPAQPLPERTILLPD